MDFRLASDADRLTGIGWLRSDWRVLGCRQPMIVSEAQMPASSGRSRALTGIGHQPQQSSAPALVPTAAGRMKWMLSVLLAFYRRSRDRDRLAALEFGARNDLRADRVQEGKRRNASGRASCRIRRSSDLPKKIERWRRCVHRSAQPNSSCATTKSKPIHRLIPKRAARPCNAALTCDGRVAAYPCSF